MSTWIYLLKTKFINFLFSVCMLMFVSFCHFDADHFNSCKVVSIIVMLSIFCVIAFIYLFERQKYNMGEWKSEICYLLFHFPNVHNDWSWSSANPEVKSFFRIFLEGSGAEILELSSTAFSGVPTWKLIRTGVAGTQTGAPKGCQYQEW